MVIDLHSHFFPVESALSSGAPVAGAPERVEDGYVLDVAGHRLHLTRELVDVDAQLDALVLQRLDRRALMPPPYTILYELSGEDGLAWSVALNDGISQVAQRDPEHFVGFATVPLQSPSAAVMELERATQLLGLQGVEILTNVDGMGLDDPSLEPFWQAAERLNVPILVHPHNVAGGDRLGEFYLRNLIGNPTETAQAGARILFAGILERYPGLKIILSHGGGALPHLIGRLRHGYEVRPECRERAEHPIEQLRRLFFDTVVFDPTILRHLVELVGIQQIVLGTDFPFDMGETDPIGFVRGSGLSQTDIETILRSGERLLA